MTAPCSPPSWSALSREVAAALDDLRADGTLELLAPGLVVNLTWLLPDRALLRAHLDLARHGPALTARGWASGAWSPPVADRGQGAGRAAAEAVAVLRDLLATSPDRVAVRRPCVPPPLVLTLPPAQEPAW